MALHVRPLEDQCVRAIVCLVALGSALAASETFFMRREWSDGGLYNWPVARTTIPVALKSRMMPLIDAIYGYPQYIVLQIVVQLFCAIALLTGLWPDRQAELLSALFCMHLLIMLRRHGIDGADQMQSILLGGLVCYFSTPNPLVKKCALWFIAAQAVLAYATAGIAKLWSRAWLTGTVLKHSLALATGSEFLYRRLKTRAKTNQLLCLALVGFECLFPIVLIVRPSAGLLFLGAGLLLHVTNAFALGLPRFVFTFVAAYPAIFYVVSDMHASK